MRGLRRYGLARALAGLGLIVTLTVTVGCDDDASAESEARWPAGAAGRACALIEYDVVERALGTRFDVAGGADHEETHTCALTGADHEFPQLVLSISPSTADKVIFTATVTPSGATTVKDLGVAGYRSVEKAAKGHGPTVEVGWLSKAHSLLIMRYTLADSGDTDDLSGKLVTLARTVEQALVGAS